MDNKSATLELGTKPVGSLLMQYAIPAIVAMVASSLYNMVDSIFIGQGVGPMAISGLAITFPFMNLSGAIGACIGVGASTYLSVKLGQKDYSMAQRILGNSVVLKIITGIIFGAICLLFLDPILRFFGASDNTLPYAHEYMVVILLGNVFTHLYFGMNALLRAASKPKQAMYATIFTVVLNTALDPIFIYTLDMGIRGAALATILSQITALCWQIKQFSNPHELLHFKRGIYKLDWSIIKNILAIGVSPLAMNTCSCIIVIFINTALVKYGGDMAVGAYGIANRIGFLFFMIVMGINQGMQIQLRCHAFRPHAEGAEIVHDICHCHHGFWLVGGRADALSLCPSVHHRCGTDRTGGERYPPQHDCLPTDWLSSGHHQFLPINRQGKDQYLPLFVSSDDFPLTPVSRTPAYAGS